MRSGIFRRSGTVLISFLTVLLFLATNASAAEKAPQPELKNAVISVEPKGQDVNVVTEKITIENANLAKDQKIEHLIVSIPGVTSKELLVSNDQNPLTFTEVKGDGLTHLFVTVPQGAKTFTYTIQQTLQLGSEESRTPLAVPIYGTNGINKNAIDFAFDLPKGMYIHTSMPNFLGPDQGPIKETLSAIPSYVKFTYGSTPQAVSSNTWIGLFNVVVILIITIIWLLNERKRGGVLNV